MRPATSTERWTLADRRDFLRRSLDDAEAEHRAGDLADTDYAILRRRDEEKLAEVESRLAALEEGMAQGADEGEEPGGRQRSRPGTARLGRPRRRVWMGLVGAAALVAGAVVLVVNLTTARLPGQVATGGAQPTRAEQVAQELDQAASLADRGKAATALMLYSSVLATDPTQPTALAEAGWLEWASGSGAGQAALERKGRALEVKAVRVAPSFYAGHLFLGTIEFHEGDARAAVAQYRLFLADHPASGWARDFAAEIRGAFTATGQPVPAGVPTV